MKCMRCGAEIMDGSNFCNVCGAPVQVVAAPVSAPQGSGDPNGGVFSTISTGSAVIWILLAVIYFYLFKYFQNEAMATRHHGPWPKSYWFALNLLATFRGFFNILCISAGCVALSKRDRHWFVGMTLLVALYVIGVLLSVARF